MAQLVVTINENQVVVSDWRPFLSKRALRSWRRNAEKVLGPVVNDLGELSSQIQLALESLEDDGDDDCECSAPQPNIGFRSTLGAVK